MTKNKVIIMLHYWTKQDCNTTKSWIPLSLIVFPCLLFVNAVTDVELKRLKDAFKRTSGLSCYMTQQCFYREVLGDGVPPKVAEVSHSNVTIYVM